MPLEHAGARHVVAVCLALLTSLDRDAAATKDADHSAEVRALWVTRSTLVTPESIARMVSAAQSGGFNTIVMQVRGRGDAYYRSSFEPRPAELALRPSFDPLAETITLAHREGLQVHAWVAVNLVSSAVDLPTSPQHIIHRQPDWLMVPKALARGLNRLDPRSPEYVARLARWTRSRPTEVEGLYASPIHPWAASHVTAIITELATNYELDGVHLDYVRFPNEEFDYSKTAIQQFKRAILPELSAADRRRADAQERVDPIAYPELFRDQWTSFRRSRLTAVGDECSRGRQGGATDHRAQRRRGPGAHARERFAITGLAHVARSIARGRRVPDGVHAGCRGVRAPNQRSPGPGGGSWRVGGHRRISIECLWHAPTHCGRTSTEDGRGHSLLVRLTRLSSEQHRVAR